MPWSLGSSRSGSRKKYRQKAATSHNGAENQPPASQPVTIAVDAYGHRKFAGYVESISPAAGSVFTLLPPDNATGNFTKIVQRLPVRIRVPKAVARENLLRAGMSVYATVDTNKGAEDADDTTDLDSPMMIHPQ